MEFRRRIVFPGGDRQGKTRLMGFPKSPTSSKKMRAFIFPIISWAYDVSTDPWPLVDYFAV